MRHIEKEKENINEYKVRGNFSVFSIGKILFVFLENVSPRIDDA